MGTWGTAIAENDTYHDVYEVFYDAYNDGCSPENAAEIAVKQCSEEFADCDTANDALFALAYAQWETKILDEHHLEKVRQVVATGDDLEQWKARGASDQELGRRQEALVEFVHKLETPRNSKKRRKRKKFDYSENRLIDLVAPDGKKTFTVTESWVNGEYQVTRGMIIWESMGGGGILQFQECGAAVEAHWTGDSELEISIDRGIELSQKELRTQLFKDVVTISYRYNDE